MSEWDNVLPKPAKIFAGTESRDSYLGWNVSIAVDQK